MTASAIFDFSLDVPAAAASISQGVYNADAGGLELLGENGVIAELTKRILERGLNEPVTPLGAA